MLSSSSSNFHLPFSFTKEYAPSFSRRLRSLAMFTERLFLAAAGVILGQSNSVSRSVVMPWLPMILGSKISRNNSLTNGLNCRLISSPLASSTWKPPNKRTLECAVGADAGVSANGTMVATGLAGASTAAGVSVAICATAGIPGSGAACTGGVASGAVCVSRSGAVCAGGVALSTVCVSRSGAASISGSAPGITGAVLIPPVRLRVCKKRQPHHPATSRNNIAAPALHLLETCHQWDVMATGVSAFTGMSKVYIFTTLVLLSAA